MLPDGIILPPEIRERIDHQPFTVDATGLSGSTVHTYDDVVLKVEKHTTAVDQMIATMRWMDGKIPVPQVLHYEVQGEWSILLMTRIPGQMACSRYYLDHSDEMVSLLAEGLKMLWAADTAGCPRDNGLDIELMEARRRVERGEVDWQGEPGFDSPADLLCWLENNKPPYEPVLSHGDYCLPNVMLQDGRVMGMIDLGDAGIADRWRDIEQCYYSLIRNMGGAYGGKVYPDFNPDILIEKLGIPMNREKLRYYSLLRMLFW